MTETPKSNDDSNDEELLRVARERFQLAEEAESDIRTKCLDDLKFLSGDQWPVAIRQQREQEHRPCLTINKMPQFVRQITNDQRQNRPSIKVSPVDDNADIETAKIFQGLIRHIENDSNADAAYDTAFEGAVGPGFGFFRVMTSYESPMSFNQKITIDRIRNQFSVYLDPFSKEPDGSDANWGFIFEDVQKDTYKSDFKDSDLATSTDWDSHGNQAPGWVSTNAVRVAEYFYKEYKDTEIVLLSDGQVVEKSILPEILPEGLTIVSERTTSVPIVKWCKINGAEVLEKTDWPGRWIPIIPVYGTEMMIDGKKSLEGIIRQARDAQTMYNYWVTTETETIALAPKAPFIAAEGQIPPEYEAQWKSANQKNHAFLTYKAVTVAGQVVGSPQRNAYEPPVQAITNARMQSSEDIKSTTGIYDASLGGRSNETSGIAIQRRNQQAQTSNFHFVDNLTRSLKHTGRVLVDMIPKVYDAARTQRILGEEGDQQIVVLNKMFENKGKATIYDLGAGQYDVSIETGPSFATKRQEALASMLDLTKAYPQMFGIVGDLMLKSMDIPFAGEMAERLKKTMPPGIADDNKDKAPVPPEIQQQMQQMDQMVQQLTASLTDANEKIKNKTMELESRERIEFAKMEIDLKKEIIKLQGQSANTMLEQELADINRRLELVGINEPIEYEMNDSGFNEAANQDEQFQQPQPTGGFPPGQPMGV